jgi:hypothetical protein
MAQSATYGSCESDDGGGDASDENVGDMCSVVAAKYYRGG